MLEPNQRKCPSCDHVHTYSSLYYKRLADKNASKCRQCRSRKFWMPEGQDMSRPCSMCDTVITYKTPELWWKAEGRDSYCRRCAAHACKDINSMKAKARNNVKEFMKLPGALKKKRSWGIAVRHRANYACEVCGDRDITLHAHHIKPKAQYPELRYDIDNGILLCIDHHAIAHEELGQPWISKFLRGITKNVQNP